MRSHSQRLTAVLAGVAVLALAGCSSAQSGESDQTTLKVVYLIEGDASPLDAVMQQAKAEYEEANPEVTVDLQPLKSSADDYFTKLALMNRSEATAPDVIYEDSFQVKSDAAAGYLAPLDDRLAAWEDWGQFVDAAKAAGEGVDGNIYAVSLGTDTQGLWYNKDVFEAAGIPLPFEPESWDDLLDAAEKIKANVPDVYPWEIYAGIQLAEAGTMRGFQTFLSGTDDSLFNEETGKWVVNSQGFEDTLELISTVYGEGYSPEASIALDPALTQTVWGTWLPEGKVGMVVDGSWLPSGWADTGATPFPEWTEKIGWAAIPTQDGGGAGTTSMSGGWTVAMGSKTKHPDEAFDFITTLLSEQNALKFAVEGTQIAVRDDVAAEPDYTGANPTVPFFTDQVDVTHFRPATPDYPQISQQIAIATEAVVNGTSPADAAKAYDQAVIGIVGEDNTESGR
ncbi:extracellular solute-binding protein [Herbiconiux moechotypicola]|uniref:Extracellular solute-binding protein n=1 Tax=Herbiconiux moechotypicola TaxID=637393 RepID=A0ABN3E2W2_9MICO|nr:extracellular solute-binding protein [Herbiconiux moechotypicola]MCS5731538.1 extracellular solute-binding protein [Herbiconiux moechotypicola]